MKKKSKNTNLKSYLCKSNELISKQETPVVLKKHFEHARKFKSPDLQITKDSKLTRRVKSPDIRPYLQHKSKEQLIIQTPVKQNCIKSMKSTPNKSLAHIQTSTLQIKDKTKIKIPTKLTSQGKTSLIGHRKTKSQQIIPSKGMNFDLFVTRNSAIKSTIKSYARRTKAGIMDGKSKVNQDSFIAHDNYLTSECSLFAVCDGHGINGHHVSETIKKLFPSNLEFLLVKNQIISKKELDLNAVQYTMQMAFKKTACDLLMTSSFLYNTGIDVDFSGSTFVSVFIYGKSIWCANIGDSRAVLYSQTFKGQFLPIDLSHDHKGQNPIEAKRILGMGGKLQSYEDQDGEPCGPLRVWIPGKNIPGLAMTRSFGDYFASTVGVISDPEIIYHKITKGTNVKNSDDKFLVIASDGLWQFVSPEIVSNVVKQYYLKQDCEGACRALERIAIKAWQDEDDIVDDITIIVVFFD